MSLYVPALPLEVDPLIAEARRRARRRRLAGLAAVLAMVVSVGSFGWWELTGANASAATAGSGRQCAGPSTYGSQCITVTGSGLRVTAIQTSFDDTSLFWPNTRWRIDLERYVCDPIGRTKAACWPSTIWHGQTRTGVRVAGHRPHPVTYLARSRNSSYWPAFSLPHAFRSNVWLCTEVAVYNGPESRWVYNAKGLAHGLRACVAIHGRPA
ncbi:MAG TPA: hypothetical protein VJP41_01185 [Gaiellaceae bacterium]|nr:hypothetical protein [Gaiellaceae bacterium]